MKIEEILQLAPVIPVLTIEDPAHAVPLARALAAGGLPVIEITLRSAAAPAAISAIAREVPEAVVGAGTVNDPAAVKVAKEAGAQFLVSPGLTDELARAAHDSQLPFLPGVMTPSEALAARSRGFRSLKLFPATAAGGVELLASFAGPLPDLTFCPTGGITAATYRDYLALPNVACVGGSWVAPKKLVAAGSFAAITELSRQVQR